MVVKFGETLPKVNQEQDVARGPNIPKWISVPIIDHGRDLEMGLSNHVTLRRRKLRQIPERLVHHHTAAVTDTGPQPLEP